MQVISDISSDKSDTSSLQATNDSEHRMETTSSSPQTDSDDFSSDASIELEWEHNSLELVENPSPNLQISSHLDNPSSRRLAVSDPTLSRTNAFSYPPDPHPAHTSHQPIPTLHFYRSRIPKPTSPSQVDLNLVMDLSNLPNPLETPRRPPPARNEAPPRRRIRQPANYKTYGTTGKK